MILPQLFALQCGPFLGQHLSLLKQLCPFLRPGPNVRGLAHRLVPELINAVLGAGTLVLFRRLLACA